MDRDLYAVIMAGGAGTRFWPVSRRARPKQFLDVVGEQPMLAATRGRLADLVPDERVIVVAGRDHGDLVREALPGLPPENLLLEPEGRNTLACVALATAEVARRDPESMQLVLPADHVIAPTDAFLASVKNALVVADASQALVTFGVRPTHPATDYGYIELGETTAECTDCLVHDVTRFVEKPRMKRAIEYVASGRFLWNSGMFIWTTGAICKALEDHAPTTWNALRDAAQVDLPGIYSDLDELSVDTALLEKSPSRRVKVP